MLIVYWSEEWSGVGLWRFLRAVLAVLLVLCLWGAEKLYVDVAVTRALWIVSAAIWVVLLATYVWRLVKARDRRAYVTRSIATPLLLLSPVPLLLQWPSVFFLILVVAAFVAMVRQMAGGQRELFAFGAALGIALIAAVGMAFYEGRAEGGTIHSPGDAFIWAFTSVFRIGGVYSYRPDTENGKILGVIVVLCGAMFSALLISKFTSWLVGERQRKSGTMSSADIQRAIKEGVALAMKQQQPAEVSEVTTVSEIASGADGAVLWIDAANVVGTRPDGWWRDRAGAADRLVRDVQAERRDGAALGADCGATQPVREIRIVLEGQSRASDTADGTSEGGVPVVVERVDGTADDYLVAHADSGDIAVTSDRPLRDRLRGRHVIVVGSKAFRDALETRS